METCDVLIVGGGPAGSSCARRLRQAGLDVLVLDKAQFPRDKTCGGWLTPQIVSALELDVDDYAAERILQPITRFRMGQIGGGEAYVHYGETVSYGIRRREFDHYLLLRAGARLRLGEPLRTWRREAGDWIVNDALRTPLLIGAAGHFCPLRRELRSQGPEGYVVRAQEVEFPLPEEELRRGTIAADCPELFFCDDLQGYAWVFRKRNYLNIGLGRLSAEGLQDHVRGFCEFLKSRGKVAADIPARFHGHAYELYRQRPEWVVADGLLLIGDSAGLAYPQSGEGIRPAVESGLLAADTVVRTRGNYTAAALEPYRAALEARFGIPGRPWSEWLPPRWTAAVTSHLLETRWFNRNVVLDRWFLHRHVPPLQLSPLPSQAPHEAAA